MVKNGARLVVEPVKGFDNNLTAFLLLNMKNTKCNLIELVKIKKQWKTLTQKIGIGIDIVNISRFRKKIAQLIELTGSQCMIIKN